MFINHQNNEWILNFGEIQNEEDLILMMKELNDKVDDIFIKRKLINEYYLRPSGYHLTLLYLTVQNEWYNAVVCLLDNQADPNKGCREDNYTPLIRSIGKNILITKLLLERGANPDLMMTNGFTALLLACSDMHYDAIKLLIENNASIDSEMYQKVNPKIPHLLDSYIKNKDKSNNEEKYKEIYDLLISKGAKSELLKIDNEMKLLGARLEQIQQLEEQDNQELQLLESIIESFQS